MYNTILIKRRVSGAAGAPGALSGGELAFNEVDSTLYYGSNAGVIAIAGSGAFVDRTSNQSISGVKTFEDGITLPDAPSADTDASNKGYVDSEIDSLSGTLQTAIDSLNSGTTTGIETLSTEVYNTFVKLTDDRAVTLTGGLDVTGGLDADSITTTGDGSIGGNLTVTGNLSVLGTQTVINTQTINISGTSTQIDIVNNGTATGITVNQTGSENVAEFYDDSAIALAIVDGGNVGIGTLTPNEKLTVSGNISASGTIYAGGGMEIASGGGATTLYVENGKIGVNTETPNEALTIVGSISASEDIYARNGTLTGTLDVSQGATFASTLSVASAVDFDSTLDVVGATTLQSTLDVTSAATFASSVSAAGALTIDGLATFNADATVVDKLQVQSYDFNPGVAGTHVEVEGTTVKVVQCGATSVEANYTLNGISTVNTNATYTIQTDNNHEILISANGGGNDIDLQASNVNITTGNLVGNAANSIVDFIIDGGTF